jgi:hypothetical protein
MDNTLSIQAKEKVLGYLRGDFSVPELYQWTSEQENFKGSLQYIKDKADIIFFLVNEAGLETSNFYVEEKIVVTRTGMIKNLNRLLKQAITAEDLFNWADDVWNWELVEGCEDELVEFLIECLTQDPDKIKALTTKDIENLISHLEKSKDAPSSLKAFEEIFGLGQVN